MLPFTRQPLQVRQRSFETLECPPWGCTDVACCLPRASCGDAYGNQSGVAVTDVQCGAPEYEFNISASWQLCKNSTCAIISPASGSQVKSSGDQSISDFDLCCRPAAAPLACDGQDACAKVSGGTWLPGSQCSTMNVAPWQSVPNHERSSLAVSAQP